MKWLTEKLAGRKSIDLVQKGILSLPRERCNWLDICPYPKALEQSEKDGLLDGDRGRHIYNTVCIAGLFESCNLYKGISQEQLEKFSTKLKHITPKEAQAFLSKLPKEIYKPYLKLILGKSDEASTPQEERTKKSHRRCALDPPYFVKKDL